MAPKVRKIPHHSTEPLIRPTHDAGEILYPDVTVLSRPLDPPEETKSYAKKVMIAAAIIAALFLIFYILNTVTAPAREKEALEQNLARQVPLDLPNVSALMPLDDNAILQTFVDQGANIFTRVAPGTSEDGSFELIKLPPDISVDNAAAMYLSGVETLSGSELVHLLNGSWVLDVYRDPTSIRVRYADFTSENLEAALNAAMASQGISPEAVTDAGVDDAGNSYRSGLMVTKEATYTWRLSAIRLASVYDIEGVPANASYVGIRFTS